MVARILALGLVASLALWALGDDAYRGNTEVGPYNLGQWGWIGFHAFAFAAAAVAAPRAWPFVLILTPLLFLPFDVLPGYEGRESGQDQTVFLVMLFLSILISLGYGAGVIVKWLARGPSKHSRGSGARSSGL